MPRMLADGRWYDPVSTRSLYEADYEAAILANAKTLFRGYYCVRFKALVESEYGNGKPDLALIDSLYRSWVVVEVELDTHPLQGHVEEQVRKFAEGYYTSAHAHALHEEDPSLDLTRLKQMLLGEQPEVLVLVTSAKPSWAPRLARFGAQVGIIEMFRDDLGQVIFRVNGDQPSVFSEEVISLCVAERLMPRLLRLMSPGPFSGRSELDLAVAGESTRWSVIRSVDTAWITPVGPWPIEGTGSSRYEIIRASNGELELRRMERV